MNDEPLMIEIPVVVKNGKVEFLYGTLPPLKEKTIGSLFIPAHGFQNPDDVERLSRTETVEFLSTGTTLHAPMKDIPYQDIILEKPLRLTFRGTKKPVLEDCPCKLPSLKITVRSLNEAYTKLSEKFEPHRRGHGGNVFQKVFYLPPGQHNWQPLDELRLAKQIAFQEKLFSRMPEKVKNGEDANA